MKHVNVYGPQGCGKTRNAEKLRKKYGCGHVIDEGRFVFGSLPVLLADATERCLVLTIEPMRGPDVTAIPFEEALR